MRTAYELVKAHYAANDRRDLPGMVADLAPDVRWTEMDGFPCRGTYVGADEIIRNVFEVIGQTFDSYTFTLETLLDAGDHAVGIGSYSGRHKGTGKSFDIRVTHVWHATAGKIDRFEQFTDTLRLDEAMR